MSNKENPDLPSNSKRKEKIHRIPAKMSVKPQSSTQSTGSAGTSVIPNRSLQNDKNQSTKIPKQPKGTKEIPATFRQDICHLSEDLLQTVRNNLNYEDRKLKAYKKHVEGLPTPNSTAPKPIDETQTQQIKKILAACLQNIDESKSPSPSVARKENSFPFTFLCDRVLKREETSGNHRDMHKALNSTCPSDDSKKNPTLLRSYLSGSIPRREEIVSKRKNVSNSLISSDSIHHSIYLESGRERRQCLLQYLSNVVTDGQVVIYANSIPAVESLLHFLNKHGFKANAVHPRMLMAESNWILSEFSLKHIKILLCAEDHFISCPAHFRWVKTIINYDLPISNPVENWTIRNGIVDFSDNLPVHIYTFIKKSCPLDSELVTLLQLNSGDREEEQLVTALPK